MHNPEEGSNEKTSEKKIRFSFQTAIFISITYCIKDAMQFFVTLQLTAT